MRQAVDPVPGDQPRPVAGDDRPVDQDGQDEARAFSQRSPAEADYVYVSVDGIHLKVRLEQDKVCLMVMIGVRSNGTKELIALDDEHREFDRVVGGPIALVPAARDTAPALAVADGSLGFWSAVRQVFPGTREQRCWFHKIANVLNVMPKSAQPGEKAALAEIWNALDRDHGGGEGVRGPVPGQVAQGGREDHRRPRRAAGVLQLPRRALSPPAHDTPYRVDLLDRGCESLRVRLTRRRGR